MEGGSFGNENFSIAAAQNMFSKDKDAVNDIRRAVHTDSRWSYDGRLSSR